MVVNSNVRYAHSHAVSVGTSTLCVHAIALLPILCVYLPRSHALRGNEGRQADAWEQRKKMKNKNHIHQDNTRLCENYSKYSGW